MALTDLILRTYPWWEMQRVREMSLGPQTPDRHLSNAWRHAPGLVDHTYRGITTPNCDTLYSGAWLDLTDGPVLIETPASTLPYWSIAVMDLFTDNMAIMGNRYPGSGSLLVCAQDDTRPIPDGLPHVRSASKVVWLLARYLIGSDELVQQAETMRRAVRLLRWPSDSGALAPAACPTRVPLVAAVRKDAQNFWQVIRTTLDEDSALPRHAPQPFHDEVEEAWPPGVNNWHMLPAPLQQRFTDAFFQVLNRVTANNSGNMQFRGQWRYPGRDIGNFGQNHVYRAEVSLWGLGALPVTEVIYVSAIADTQGAPLQGTHGYRFSIPPAGIPAKAFWSLTMYEVDPFGGMYFTANPLKRYAIGDRTTGLLRNADGSIDIWIAHQPPPDPRRLANWLPAPTGQFRLMIRAYAPTEPFLTGHTLPPAVEMMA